MSKKVKVEDIEKWIELREQKFTYKEIGHQTGWNPETVRKYLYRISLNPEVWYLAVALNNTSILTNFKQQDKILKELLQFEKEKRGINKNQLVFVGMANIANYYWCAMQSVFKSRNQELMFFKSYLYDKIRYSLSLDLIDNSPMGTEALLNIGNEITFDDIEKLLRKKREQRIGMVIERNLSDELEKSPLGYGEYLHNTKAEQYPSIRWNFQWGNYVIVGVPDGITDQFVYEFKSTKNNFLKGFIKPVAITQADLYGYFFKRNKKRVQIYNKEEKKTETLESNTDKLKVESVLKNFDNVDAGWNPPEPNIWKCKTCSFKTVCTITPLK